MDDIVRDSDIRMGIKRSAKEREAHLIETLQKVRLQDGERILESYPMMLSGGMRQRVLIGMALLNKPKLLIADEPGTALDVTTQDEILTLLNNLVAEEGLSLLLITHNLGVVRKMADRVYVMEHGKIVETGSRDAIFQAPKHEYTKKLMGAVPPLYGDKVKTIDYKGTTPAIEVKINNIPINPKSSGLKILANTTPINRLRKCPENFSIAFQIKPEVAFFLRLIN